MTTTRLIWCCECGAEVEARLADGVECYPGRSALGARMFWKCDGCGNFVGTHYQHHKPALRLEPLGSIPGPELKEARRRVHDLLDPIWQSKKMSRQTLYGKLDRVVRRTYHTGDLRTIEEAWAVYRALQAIRKELGMSKR